MNEIEIFLEKESGEKEITLENEGTSILPTLEDLEVTPTKEQQVFKHENSDGYDNVIINAIPNEYIIPKLQDVEVELIKNGEHTIIADSGYDGLNSVHITTNVKGGGSEGDSEEPNYIQDGLVAWWDGADEPDTNGYWLSRVGTDYIYERSDTLQDTTGYNNYRILHSKKEKCYRNNGVYALVTRDDYFKMGYTIEVVGKTLTNIGGKFIAFDRASSPVININDLGNFTAMNNNSFTYDKTYKNCNKKKFTFALHLHSVPGRTNSGYYRMKYSINGDDWSSTNNVSLTSQTNKGNHMVIMGYYATSPGMQEINSIRVYNRLLTHEELMHNHEEDKKRFDLDEYVN